jgi:hypothetical protein
MPPTATIINRAVNALADPTRRAMLRGLADEECTIGEWLAFYRRFWAERLDDLERALAHPKPAKAKGRKR